MMMIMISLCICNNYYSMIIISKDLSHNFSYVDLTTDAPVAIPTGSPTTKANGNDLPTPGTYCR